MPSTTFETIDNRVYRVIRNNDGNIVSKAVVDPIVQSNKRQLTKFQFRCLLTMDEKKLIDNIENNPNISDDTKETINTLRIDFQLADSILLDHPLTILGINFLESVGILGSGRAEEILNNTPPSG
jgi:hypothetical protein